MIEDYDLKGHQGVAAVSVGRFSPFNTKALDVNSIKWKTWFPHSTCFLLCEMGDSPSEPPTLSFRVWSRTAAAGLGV